MCVCVERSDSHAYEIKDGGRESLRESESGFDGCSRDYRGYGVVLRLWHKY